MSNRTRDFLLEIGVEDLPPSFVPSMLEQLKRGVETGLAEKKILFGKTEVMGTHRRLVVLVKSVEERRMCEEVFVQGPPEKVAFRNGRPTDTLRGFLRAKGASIKNVEVKETPRGRYVFVKVRTGGDSVLPHLSDLAQRVIHSLSAPKTMRWDSSGVRFPRPLRYVLALYGNRVVPFSFGNVSAGRKTCPDRLSRKAVTVRDVREYFQIMKKAGIILDPLKRASRIRSSISRLAAGAEAKALISDEAIEEVVFMTEHPRCVLCPFDERFVRLPREVVSTVLQHHIRAFPLTRSNGQLYPAAVFVADTLTASRRVVRAGLQRVITARLEDAEFYYMEDRKRDVKSFVEALKGINFGEGLGTMWDRIGRIETLLEIYGGIDEKKLGALAQLMDFDLATSLVSEFPELHGVIGRIYAVERGFPDDVAEALEEHVLPRFSGDKLPSTPLGVAAAVCDRVDSICGHMAAGHKPTAEADPFGVRRETIGLCEILLEHFPDINLEELVKQGLRGYASEALLSETMEFILQRFRQQAVRRDLRRDFVEACIISPYNPRTFIMRYRALEKSFKRGLLPTIVATCKRLNNILKGAQEMKEPEASLFREKEEWELFHHVEELRQHMQEIVDKGDFDKALEEVATLAPVVNRFFEKVFVMVEDPLVRRNRLSLLDSARKVFSRLADFSKIEFTEEIREVS